MFLSCLDNSECDPLLDQLQQGLDLLLLYIRLTMFTTIAKSYGYVSDASPSIELNIQCDGCALARGHSTECIAIIVQAANLFVFYCMLSLIDLYSWRHSHVLLCPNLVAGPRE